jgi:hypothetical protein
MNIINRNRIVATALLTVLFAVMPVALAANDPGHDNLYVLKLGDSNVTGSINLSAQLTAQLVRVSNKFFGDYLDIVANGTVVNPSSVPAIQAAASSLYIDSTGSLYLNTKAGTSSTIQVGDPATNLITLNVSGTIRQQGVQVCLANGTNCLSGNNTGNISSITAGNGITITNPSGPTVTIAANATTCGGSEYSYWSGSAWLCRTDQSGGGNVSGAGATGTLAKWTGTGLIGNSIVSESGTVLTVNGSLLLGGSPSINTTSGNLTIDSAGGYVIINIG